MFQILTIPLVKPKFFFSFCEKKLLVMLYKNEVAKTAIRGALIYPTHKEERQRFFGLSAQHLRLGTAWCQQSPKHPCVHLRKKRRVFRLSPVNKRPDWSRNVRLLFIRFLVGVLIFV